METTNVMFVDSTPHGVLCSRLQKCEDRNGTVTNRRVKMVEMGGTQLGQHFSNTDPWGGAGCERIDCYTCTQGGEERKEDCFKRNILYESRCSKCKEEQELEEQVQGGPQNKKNKFNPKERGVYVGESSRSLYERTKEHLEDARKDTPDSHIRKHWRECHPEDEQMPHFRFKIVKTFKDSLSRQVAESVRIDMRDGVINSKAMYIRNRLPRLEVEKPEWERNEEERRKKLQKWKKKENWDFRTKSQEEKDRLQQAEET